MGFDRYARVHSNCHSHRDHGDYSTLLRRPPYTAHSRVEYGHIPHRRAISRELFRSCVVHGDTAHQRRRHRSHRLPGVVRVVQCRVPCSMLDSLTADSIITAHPSHSVRVHRRMVRECHLNLLPSRVGVRSFLTLLVESGALYCLVWVRELPYSPLTAVEADHRALAPPGVCGRFRSSPQHGFCRHTRRLGPRKARSVHHILHVPDVRRSRSADRELLFHIPLPSVLS